MERSVIIVNGFQLLTIIIKRSILDVAAVLDPPQKSCWKSYVKYPGVLMVKKPDDRSYSVYMVATD